MNKKELFDAMGLIDEKLIADSETYTAKNSRNNILKFIIPAAACLCIVAVAVYAGGNIKMGKAKSDSAELSFDTEDHKDYYANGDLAEEAMSENAADQNFGAEAVTSIQEETVAENTTAVPATTPAIDGSPETFNENNAVDTDSVKRDMAEYRCIRVIGVSEETAGSGVTVIHTRAELEKYYTDNKDALVVYSASSGDFASQTAQYNDKFFENNSLIIVKTTEGSGSYKYAGLGLTDDTVTIYKVVPEVCTEDMAYWAVLIPVDKLQPIANKNPGDIHVNFVVKQVTSNPSYE